MENGTIVAHPETGKPSRVEINYIEIELTQTGQLVAEAGDAVEAKRAEIQALTDQVSDLQDQLVALEAAFTDRKSEHDQATEIAQLSEPDEGAEAVGGEVEAEDTGATAVPLVVEDSPGY